MINHMRRSTLKHPFVITALIVSSLSGCATISTGAHYDETTNFGEYRTFAWIDADPYISSQNDTAIVISPLTRSKIQHAIHSGFASKGYEYVEDLSRADFVIAYTVGTRREVSVESYPETYNGPWGWHVRGSHYYVNEVSTHSYTKGTLGVDVFDGASNKPVWHGWAEKTVTESDRQDPGPAINESVAKLLESFPQ